jgi:hypothetical protein
MGDGDTNLWIIAKVFGQDALNGGAKVLVCEARCRPLYRVPNGLMILGVNLALYMVQVLFLSTSIYCKNSAEYVGDSVKRPRSRCCINKIYSALQNPNFKPILSS